MSAGFDFEYRGEGNASIVVSDCKTHMVYRLKKKKTGAVSNYVQEHVEKINSFLKHVILPSFSREFVRVGNEVTLTEEFWSQIPSALEGKRPLQRQRSEVDTAQTTALSLPDLCFVVNPYVRSSSPTIAIEIKCKKGFLPKAECLSQQTKLKSEVCRFCIHQETKVAQGTWKEISLYCPVDLFSGEVDRMRHAFQCLTKTPQNNLRIFKDGGMVWGQDKRLDDVMIFEGDPSDGRSTPDDLIDLIIQCLRAVPSDWQGTGSDHGPRQLCRNSSYVDSNPKTCSELPDGCILERLLHLQRLDDCDVEAILPLYQKIKEEVQNKPELSEELHLDGPFEDDGWNADCTDLGPPDSFEYAVNKVKQFMISATAKDSSIMIALQPLTKEEYEMAKGMPQRTSCQLLVAKGSHHPYYQYTISLVDLDPKDWRKIPKYYEQDVDVLKTFLKKRPHFQKI